MAKTNRKAITKLGKDEMNLAEFPLSVVGKRPPGKAKTLHFEDEVWDRSQKQFVPRRLTITASDLLGLPNSLDDEVLLGCVQLAKEQNFTDRKLRFSRYGLLELIRWSRDGKNYRRLNESLKRWAGTLVISDKAYWNKRTKSWVEDSFNIIDRNLLAEAEEDSSKISSSLIWGDFMWQSFQAGNLKTLDFDFWLKLRSPVSKRLFRLLDKRFYYECKIVRFDLRQLAFDKVGLSRRMHTGQIKEKLNPAHRELRELGKYQAEYSRQSRGKWEVKYQRLGATAGEQASNKLPDPLIKALQDRGIKNARKLVAKYSRDRIKASLENFDDRRSHGDDLQPGWLGAAITQGDYAFRPGYRAKVVSKRQHQAEHRQVLKERRDRGEVARQNKQALEEFRQFYNSLSPEDRAAKEKHAIESAKRAGDKMLATLVAGSESTGALRRELWRKYVLTDKEE